jgi:hypothetical protein
MLATIGFNVDAKDKSKEEFKSNGVDRYNISRGFEYLSDLNLSGFLVKEYPDSIIISVDSITLKSHAKELKQKLKEAKYFLNAATITISMNEGNYEASKVMLDALPLANYNYDNITTNVTISIFY